VPCLPATLRGCEHRYYNDQFDFYGKRPKQVGEIHLGSSHGRGAEVCDVNDGDLPQKANGHTAFCVHTLAPDQISYFICESNADCHGWKGALTAWVDADIEQKTVQDNPYESPQPSSNGLVEVEAGERQESTHPTAVISLSRNAPYDSNRASAILEASLQLERCAYPFACRCSPHASSLPRLFTALELGKSSREGGGMQG